VGIKEWFELCWTTGEEEVGKVMICWQMVKEERFKLYCPMGKEDRKELRGPMKAEEESGSR
jgi:hypothetical protein